MYFFKKSLSKIPKLLAKIFRFFLEILINKYFEFQYILEIHIIAEKTNVLKSKMQM